MNRRFRIVIIFAVVAFILSACELRLPGMPGGLDDQKPDNNTGSDVIVDRGPEKGGIVKLFSTNPDTLNPLLTKNPYIQDLSGLIYEGLVRLDPDNRPVPCLAESWEVSKDGLVWTFHLRKSVLWQDRMPLTADDIVFTFTALKTQEFDSVYKANLNNVAGFTAKDRHTLEIKLVNPNSFMAELLAIPVLPRHKFKGDSFAKPRSAQNMAPVGTGPFKFAYFKENTNIQLKANTDWWNKGRGSDKELELPYLSEVNIRIYPTPGQALNSFQTGGIDVAPAEENTGNKYSFRNDLITRSYTDRNFEFIVLNQKHQLLKDSRIRKALAFAVDKSRLINNVLPGEAVAADLPIPPDTWLYNTDILHYVPDRAKTKEIFKQSGWSDNNGVMMKYNTPLTFELLVNSSNQTRVKLAEELKKQLAEAGITLNIKLDTANNIKRALDNKRFDMALLGCRTSSVPDISFMYASGNPGGYSNSAVDKLLEDIRKENGEDGKKALFSDLKRIINDDVPYIGLYFNTHAILYNKKLKGDMSPTVTSKYNDLPHWYIPGSEK